jgi:transcriptional regulator with XRE-family HTH domain
MDIGKKIVEQRKKANLTQEQLASELFISRQTLSRWESNAFKPDVDSLYKMAKLFNVSADYFLSDGEEKKKGLTDYQIADIKSSKKILYVMLAVLFIVFIGLFLLVYFLTRNSSNPLTLPLIIIYGIFLLLVAAVVTFAIVRYAKYLDKTILYLSASDYESYLEINRAMAEKATKGRKEIFLAQMALAYLELDRIEECRNIISSLKNPYILSSCFDIQVMLDLDEGKYSEGKAVFLSYALTHRHGRSQTERHVCQAYDGFFNVLEGNKATPEQQKDMDDLISAPLGRRLLMNAPFSKDKIQSKDIAQAAVKQNEHFLSQQINVLNGIEGKGERRFQPFLSSFFWITLFVPLFLFLILLIEPEKAGDPTYLAGSNFGWMAFGAFLGLFCLLSALFIHKREEKDKYVKNVILGTAVTIICLVFSFFPLMGSSAYYTDYSYVKEVSEEINVPLPSKGTLLGQKPDPNRETPPLLFGLRRESIVNFTDQEEYQSFESSLAGSSFWVSSEDERFDSIRYTNEYYWSKKYYAFDYVLFYHVDSETLNPTSQNISGNFLQLSHIQGKSWLLIDSYYN